MIFPPGLKPLFLRAFMYGLKPVPFNAKAHTL
jgi:hypothetical protein